MSLKTIFQTAWTTGYLTNYMKAKIEELCAPESILSPEDNFYLDLLMGAIFAGEIS